ncbi:MAG: YfhO family protein, partial [Phycisphaerae bacterium]|nr:YfhO family protein [Phycisphaerae bacterium]
ASFSFPPENLLTLVAPDAFGTLESPREGQIGYFGRAYLWEVSTFIGSTALILACYAVIRLRRRAALLLVMIAVTALLGLGANTPVHRILFDWLPGFSTFRGSSKFFFLTSLFLVCLAATGYRELLRRRSDRAMPMIAAGIALALAIGGLCIRASGAAGPEGAFARLLVRIAERAIEMGDPCVNLLLLQDRQVILQAAAISSRSLLIASAWGAAVGCLTLLGYWWRPAMLLVALAGIAEVFVFARVNRPTSPMDAPLPSVWAEALDRLPDGVRFVRNPSTYERRPGRQHIPDAWGYDPGVLRRYAELMYAGQNYDPDLVESSLGFRIPAFPIFRLARIGLVLESQPQSAAFPLPLAPLPQALLVPSARAVRSRDEMFAILTTADFDPAYTVLLDRPPAIPIAGRSPIPVPMKVIDTDTREFQIDVATSAVLLVTEAYSRYWRVAPVSSPPPGQGAYEVLPGNWAFLAIPLAQGRHHFRLEYVPRGYMVGLWISLGTTLAFAGACVVLLTDRARRATLVRQ